MHTLPPIRLSLLLLTGIALADIAGRAVTPLVMTGWASQIVMVTGLLIFAGIFTVLWPVRALAEIGFYVALWWAFAAMGCVATYLAAAHGAGLADDGFVAIDRALGFDWPAWARFVHDHAWLAALFQAAYMSLPFQIFGSILIFAVFAPDRNEQLFLTAALALVVTTLISAVLPAAGPFIHFGESSTETLYFAHVSSIRTGAPHQFDLGDLQGIVCFPSYHTVLALVFTMCHRGLKWTYPLVVALNAIMLLSIPSEGGHYLADMLGAFPIALGSMAAAKWAISRRRDTAFRPIQQASPAFPS